MPAPHLAVRRARAPGAVVYMISMILLPAEQCYLSHTGARASGYFGSDKVFTVSGTAFQTDWSKISKAPTRVRICPDSKSTRSAVE